MSNTAESVLAVARNEIGYSRWDDPQPGTKYGRWYEEQIDRDSGNYDFGASGVPFCAMYVSWVLAQAGASCVGFPGAYCPSIVQAGRSRGKTVSCSNARPGDVVLFDWNGDGDSDHVGFVESNSGSYLQCIEGNTNNGAVARRTRAYSTVICVIRPDYDGASSSAKQEAKAAQKVLFGIDVSSNQPESIVADADNDFAIVKMSGNPKGYAWNYVNPYARKQAADAMAKHGRLGLYHFTWGKDANTEAEFFVQQVKALGYLGKCMLVIDYEAYALALGRSWVGKFAQRVEKLAGYKPVIYASGSVIIEQDLFSLGYPIWCANYYRGYDQVDGRSTSGMKIYSGCEKSVLWQFTSQGKVSGYSGLLDCNVFLGGDWGLYTGSAKASPSATPAASSGGKLDVDGIWGKLTTSALQKALGTPVDGIVSDQDSYYRAKNPGLDSGSWEWHKNAKRGSQMVRALQKKIGAGVDGIAGDETFSKLQAYLGTPVDGCISSPSTCVKELQRRLNAGTF